MSDYYLVEYIENGKTVFSAVHWRDLSKFRAEFQVVSITPWFVSVVNAKLDLSKGQIMEMISVPRLALEEQAAYWTAQKEKYAQLEMTAMEYWAEGKANVYQAILEAYGR